MKKYLIIPVVLLFSSGLTAQGLYNNGAKMVIGSGAYVYLDGTGGNYLNESSGGDGAIALDGTLALEGNYTNNVAGSDILATTGIDGQVEFLGTTGQTLGGTTTAPFVFNHLLVNNPTWITISNNTTVNGTLTLADGLVIIGDNDFGFGLAASVAGTPSASAMIVATGAGTVNRKFSSAGSFTFPVGDNDIIAEYSPVTLDFTSGTFAPGAFAGINLVNAPYSDPYITGSFLNRYWNVSQTGISSFSCNALFQYTTGDVVGTESDIYCIRINPLPITPFNPADIGLHQLTATGLTSFGTFTGGLGIKFLSLKLYLEGLYDTGGIMKQAQGIAGNEYPGTVADQLTVELHDPVTYSNMQYSIGNIDLDRSGTATVHIPTSFTGTYYITVKNRNHIATVSSVPVDLTNPLINYDFSTALNKSYGDNQKLLEPGVFGLYAGDPNEDGVVDALDLLSIQNGATAFSTGYLPTDLNGDGAIDVLDLILAQNNAILFISTITP
jgi:hypothetical protein